VAKLTTAKLSDLIPDASNANLHSERGTYMVSRSLEKLGAGRSILIDRDNEIIAGNLTTEQAAAMGLEEVIIVETDGNQLVAVKRVDMDLDDPATGAREMAYADNRAAIVSIDFDPERVKLDYEAGLDLGDWWQDFELEELGVIEPEPLADAPPQIDRAEELREKWGVESGQLWQLGEHRVMCGDCTDGEVVEGFGVKADLLWTDPPYHVGKTFEGGYDEGVVWNADFQAAWFDIAASNLKESAQKYICFAQAQSINAIRQYEPNRLLVWCKPFALMRSNSWDWAYEFTAWIYPGDKPPHFDKPDGQKSFDWQNIASPIHGHEGKHHITQKPIDLPALHIAASCPDSGVVLDPFLGSGTTLIACERLGRKCYGVEIEPKYVAVTLQRWADVTGREPVLLEN
jgi:DNA modification methylase